MRELTDRHLVAVLLLLLAVTFGIAGCRGSATDGTAPGDAPSLPLDGEGMEPRIVTEHPVDAPGRPAAAGPTAATALEAAPAASWIPHLEVTDLEASGDFYRGLGFAVTGREPDEGPARRLLLSREGARLVLVAAELPSGPAEGSDEEEPPAPEEPALVLHLVTGDEEAGERTVGDPDGHRLTLPGPG